MKQKKGLKSFRKQVFISGKIPRLAYDLLSKEFEVKMHYDLNR